MSKRIQITVVAVLCLAFFTLGRWTCQDKWVDVPAARILNPVELQKAIGVKPDGLIGPETMKAWDEYINNQYGLEACLKAGMR